MNLEIKLNKSKKLESMFYPISFYETNENFFKEINWYLDNISYKQKIEIFKEVIQLGKDKKKKKKYGMDDIIAAGIQEGMKEGMEKGITDALKEAGKEDMIDDIMKDLKEEGYGLEDDKESEENKWVKIRK